MPSGKQVFSNLKSEGQIEMSLQEVEVSNPKPHEVIVEVQCAPINPSDMWPMFGPSDLSKAELSDDKTSLTAPVHPAMAARFKSRLDQELAVGNEGAGVVVEAGDSPEAQSLLGKTVAILSGSAFANYSKVPLQMVLPHNEGVTAKQAAASFVNPLTALGMVETMRMEGHSALVHTAAASNLGQMLNKICQSDGVDLVNIVRKDEQVAILEGLGAKYIVNSSADTYQKDLYKAIEASGATLAFDATGGGTLASDILTAMEMVGSKDAVGLNTYGSTHSKQVYLYGGLDISPTVLNRAYGMTWGVGGWLLMQFLMKAGPEKAMELRQRVADEINTTFASHFTDEISFEEMLTPEVIANYNAKRTGEKYCLIPN
ncbi:MAG: zinc-binding dehydrogenase [Pseudomonadota bacterium]